MYWQNAWKYTCVRARVHVCTCGLPAYFVILIARGRPPPLLQPNSAPSLPTLYCTAPLHPMLTPPFLCASSSCSTRRHPSENLRLSDNLQSHVFSCVSAPQWYMSCHKYVSELHSIYVHRDRFLVWVLFLIATIEFFISLSNHAINESYFVIFQKKKKEKNDLFL